MRLTRRLAAGLAGTAAGLAALTAVVLVTRQPTEPVRYGAAVIREPAEVDLRAVGSAVYARYVGPIDEAYALEEDRLGIPLVHLLRFKPGCKDWAFGCEYEVTPAMVADFARRYRGRWYALSNEPNLAGQDWCNSCGEYWAWYQTYFQTIKTADPSARILGPAVFNWDNQTSGWPGIASGRDWYPQWLPYDLVSLHVYPGYVAGGASYCGDMAAWQVIARNQVAGALALGRPVAITEWGLAWPKCAPGDQPAPEVRRENVRAFVAWLGTQNVAMAIFYANRIAWDDPYAPLVGDDGGLTPEGLGFLAGRPAVAPNVPAPGPWRGWLPVVRRGY